MKILKYRGLCPPMTPFLETFFKKFGGDSFLETFLKKVYIISKNNYLII